MIMEIQAKRSKRQVDETREFDKTQLKARSYGYNVHRDYAAHFFRWGWVSKLMTYQKKILDVGCGQDLPLVRVMKGNKSTVPTRCVSVDLNKIKDKPNLSWLTVLDEFNICNSYGEIIKQYGTFDVAVALEVIEHMTVDHGRMMLDAIYKILSPGGHLVLSTPVFDGKAAANHIHEYTVPELQGVLEKAGFKIINRFGTFASWPQLKKVITPEELELCERLKTYYNGEVISCFLAPLYPDHSRNNIWLCERRD